MKKNKNIPLNLREQMNSRIGLICSVILLLLLVAGLRQLDYNLIEKPKEEAAKVAQKEAEAAKKAAEEPEVSTASVIAVGDNLYHGSLIESGENDSGTWNYDQIYDKVRDEIQAADVAMVDQETVFTTEHDAVSSYPSFATPTEVGDALMNAGFDVVESAQGNSIHVLWMRYPELPLKYGCPSCLVPEIRSQVLRSSCRKVHTPVLHGSQQLPVSVRTFLRIRIPSCHGAEIPCSTPMPDKHPGWCTRRQGTLSDTGSCQKVHLLLPLRNF